MPSPAPILPHSFALARDGVQLSYYTSPYSGSSSVAPSTSLLLVHGAMTSALSHRDLAVALSPYFTVHVASRRTRGRSGKYPETVDALLPTQGGGEMMDKKGAGSEPAVDNGQVMVGGVTYPRTYPPTYSGAVLDTDVSDLDALLAATGATAVMGVSSGAIVLLAGLLRLAGVNGSGGVDRAASTLPALARLTKAIIFEPPLFFSDHAPPPAAKVDLSLMGRYESERRRGDDNNAMVSAMHLVRLGPGWIPRWIMARLTGMMMKGQEGMVEKERATREIRRGTAEKGKSEEEEEEEEGVEEDGNITMRGLGRVLCYDFAVAEAMIQDSSAFAAVADAVLDMGPALAKSDPAKRQILLLYGDRTPLYLQDAMCVLEKTIPGAQTAVISGAGHEVVCGPEMRGRPQLAVPAITGFMG